MANDLRVASPPSKPLLVFDGDCGFCRRWVARAQGATGDAVEYIPFQDESIAARFPEIPRQAFQEAVRLILPDGAVLGAALAAFHLATLANRERWLLWCYQRIPPFAALSEFVYKLIAARRMFFSKLDRLFFSSGTTPAQYVLVRYLFLRGLALIYLIAFGSFWVQEQGLIGSDGIVPAQMLVTAAKTQFDRDQIGLDRFHILPTFAWLSATDRALQLQCAAGVAASLCLLAGVAPAAMLAALWMLYLSLCAISSPFLDFQWDNLLLETGFLAIFLAPLQWWERPSRRPGPSRIVIWLLRWLLFRLMFESGCVKLLSEDASWWHLTALRVHYETQPLPTWIGWYFHQAPLAFQRTCCALMFFVELAVPFFIFAGRRARMLAAALFVLLQLVILLTGNYTFFNWLTILLCLPLLTDSAVIKAWPRGWRLGMGSSGDSPSRGCRAPQTALGPPRGASWNWKITLPIALVIVLITSVGLLGTLRVPQPWPRPVFALYDWLEPFRSLNNYGLFRVMTLTRPEIIVEGSNDAEHWQPYEFKYKPGALNRRPAFVAPYQPRLDWQMWFAALGSVQQNRWFVRFEYQLLRNSPAVLGLLGRNPFPTAAPKYVRAQLYEYHFTNRAERRATGDWWRREFLRPYIPPLSLQDFERPSGAE